jgi:hypothetical protein
LTGLFIMMAIATAVTAIYFFVNYVK